MQGTEVPHVPAGVCPSLESLGMRGELLWRLIRFPDDFRRRNKHFLSMHKSLSPAQNLMVDFSEVELS